MQRCPFLRNAKETDCCNKFSFLPELDGRSNYMIVAVTIAFITGWGVEHVKTGEMSDEVNQFLISNHAWAFSWKELIITYNEAQGQLDSN